MSLEVRLRKLHDGRFGKDRLRVYAEIHGTVAAGKAVLSGTIANPDHPDGPVGDITRHYIRCDAYTAEVYNAGLGLPREYQGRGFNSALSAEVERGYRKENIRYIRLVAGREAGGVVWASTFDFDDSRLPGFGEPRGVGAGGEDVRLPQAGAPEELRLALVVSIADAAVADARITEEERRDIDELLPELTHPALVKALDGPLDGIGSRLLRRSRWPGIKDLVQVLPSP